MSARHGIGWQCRAGNLRQDFMEQTPTYDDYPMDLSHPMPQIPTVIVESVQQQRERKEHARVAKKVEERKTKRNRRKRVSTTLHNDMDSYLGGYGADYGAEPTDSELLALPSMEQPVAESRQARKKPRKGFLSSILGGGNRLTASKSAQVLREMASSSSHDLELSKSTTALTEEKVREPLLSKQTFDSQEEDDNSSLHSGPADDHRADSRAGFGRRQVGFSPIREIIVHPATLDNGFDQLTQSSTNLSDEDGDALHESDSGADEPDKVFRLDAQVITPLRAAVEEMDVVEDDDGGSFDVEPVKKPARVLPAGSQDSLDAHASHESLVSDETSYVASDGEERGKSDLPQETAHYTESVLRLQDAHSAYQEEHFGKKKKSKRPLKKWFRSKSDDSHEKRTMI